MNRKLRRALLWSRIPLGVLFVLAVVAALAVSAVDWNRAKPALVARLQAALGRDVRIDGDLRVAWHVDTSKRVHPWLPRLNVAAERVTIGNVPEGKQQHLAEFQALDFDLLPWALLAHEIALGSIHATAPVLHLERYSEKRNNWTFGASADAPGAWHVRLGRIAFDAGQFDLDDAVRKLTLDVAVTALDQPLEFDDVLHEQERRARERADGKAGHQATAEVQDGGNEPRTHTTQRYRFAWKARGSADGSAVGGSGRIGGLLALRDDEQPWPIAGELTTGKTHIEVVGTLKNPTDLAALDLRLWLTGANLADLYPLFRLTLPQTRAFTTDGHLSGEFHADGNKFSYENFHGRIGDSDVAGSVAYDGRRERPLLSGEVRSDLLQFSDLGPLVGTVQAQDPNKVLPTAHYRVERWRSMDAAIDFAAKRLVRHEQLPINDIHTHIALDNGVLTLKPLQFAIAGGKADAELRVDGTVAPPHGTFKAGAHGLKMKELFPGVELMQASIGQIDGDVEFKTHGDSIAELLGHAAGELKLVVDGGSVSKAVLEKAGLNLANFAITRLTGDEQVRINCAAGDFALDDGVMRSRLVFIDTADALIRIEGDIDLGKESLALTVHPDAKQVRLLSLRSPLRVTGTFKHPDVAVDKRSLLVRGGGAVALAALAPVAALVPLTATSGDTQRSCPAVFAQLREGASARRKH